MKNNLRQRLWVLGLIARLACGGIFFWRAPNALAQLETIVGAVTISPPFIWEDETGVLSGFDIDLINALAAQASLSITYTKTELRYLLPGVATRLYDVGSGCLLITPERQAQVHFTRPYFATGLTLLAPATLTTTTSLGDLTAEMTVGVREGSVAEAFAHSQSTALVNPMPSIDDVFAKVEAGELNAAIASEAIFLGYQMDHPETNLKMLGGLLTYSECGLAVNQTDTALLDQLNAALAEIKSNGSYDTIYRKWFNERTSPEKPVEPTPSDVASTSPSPTPVATPAAASTAVTSTADLTGIYYLTTSGETAPEQGGQAEGHYQILILAANGLWFVTETPAPLATNNAIPDAQTGQPGLWFVNEGGQVEAMILTFSAPIADNGASAVIRKDYTMKVDSNGAVVGSYRTTHYTADLFTLDTTATAELVQTIEFSGQRVQ